MSGPDTAAIGEWDEYAPWEIEAGATLLDDVAHLLARYVAFPSRADLHAVVLWAAHTHAVEAFESTPRLVLLSPEKQSGKTRTLEVLELLVPTPMHAVNCTPAALFRAVEAKQPTLLFDEADTYFGPRAAKDHEELRGLLNAGHRRGAVAYRCVGEPAKMQIKDFPAYAAVALAGIGDMPDTILDRSVVIRMRRRAPHEQVEPFRHRKVAPLAEALKDRLATWAKAARDELAVAEPSLPPGLTDRPADVWEPLVAVADVAGGQWPERARVAAVQLNAARVASDPSLGVQLLADIRRVFDTERTDRLSTDDLVSRLVTLEEAPWGELRGKPIDARGVARRLRAFDVRPSSVRVGDATPRGYLREWFADAWARYLPDTPGESATTATPQQRGGSTNRTVAPVASVALCQGEEEA